MLTDSLPLLIAHGPHGGSEWDGGFFFPWFPFLFLLVLATVFIVSGVRRRRWQATAPRRDAESVLGERFARGEIDEEEYRTRREVLRDQK